MVRSNECWQASGHSMTVNVEYNQLDPLLRATSHPDGDANDDTGFSPFPGAAGPCLNGLIGKTPCSDVGIQTDGTLPCLPRLVAGCARIPC